MTWSGKWFTPEGWRRVDHLLYRAKEMRSLSPDVDMRGWRWVLRAAEELALFEPYDEEVVNWTIGAHCNRFPLLFGFDGRAYRYARAHLALGRAGSDGRLHDDPDLVELALRRAAEAAEAKEHGTCDVMEYYAFY